MCVCERPPDDWIPADWSGRVRACRLHSDQPADCGRDPGLRCHPHMHIHAGTRRSRQAPPSDALLRILFPQSLSIYNMYMHMYIAGSYSRGQ